MMHTASMEEEMAILRPAIFATVEERDALKRSLAICRETNSALIAQNTALENEVVTLREENARLKQSPGSILLDEWEPKGAAA